MSPLPQHLIQSYGYVGIFASLMLGMFGLPIPDETILAFTGFLLSKHYFHPVPAFLLAYLGSIFGITVNYLVGRTIGLPLLHKYGRYIRISEEKLQLTHQWYENYGKWSLFGGYFLPGFRHLTPFIAGVSGLEFRHFAPFAYTGGFLWVAVFIAIGYFLGEEWRLIIPQIESYLWILAAAVVFLGFCLYLILKFRRRNRAA